MLTYLIAGGSFVFVAALWLRFTAITRRHESEIRRLRERLDHHHNRTAELHRQVGIVRGHVVNGPILSKRIAG